MKLTHCPRCGGVLRPESIGWRCAKCRGFIDMQGNFHEFTHKPFMPPNTNADRIRAMSDELLAAQLAEVFCKGFNASTSVVIPDELVKEIMEQFLEQLKQPAEGE